MKKHRDRISKKISILRAEKVPQRQAVAEALSMERAGRIRPDGSYIHARGRKRKKSGR